MSAHVYALEIEWSRPSSSDPALPPLVGPFPKRADAEEWARLNVVNGSWNVTPLALPYQQVQP